MEGDWFCILIFFSTLLSIFTATSAMDTMNIPQSIRYNETVVSAGGAFELGFFNPDNSKERFLGIWYKTLVSSSKTVVWVANRETPIVDSDSSSLLKFTNPGNLVLLNGNNTTIWSSNVTGSVVNPVAQLLESGNLVVRNNDDPDNFLWQSFDYPCDTFLPGMKLGRNTITGHDWYLQSWKSSNDPSPGEFTIRVDPLGFPQLVILKNSTKQFRSGPWNGILFNGMHDSSPKPIYKFSFSFNQKEIYYTYELINRSISMRMVLNQNGVMQGLTWNDPTKNWNVELTSQMDDCDKYAHCGAYGNCNIYNQTQCGCLDRFVPKYPNDWVISDWSNGCVRRTPLNCAGGDGFIKYPGIKLPDTRSSWFNVTMTLEECRMRCLKNCSCMAYASLDISKGGSGCLLWSDDLFDIRTLTENGQDIYIRMASSEVGQVGSSGRKRDKPRVIILVLSFGTVLLVLCLILALYLWRRMKKPIREGIEAHNPESNPESQKGDLELPLFDLATVDKATNNFSINNKIGEGGFGPVYKGVLEGGQEVAVKRLSQDSRQGLDEFKNEVKCIAKLQHRNLVKLLGCCIEEKMLIYEYLPNKSLDFFIFDQTSSMLLDWSKRFNIIIGIARGLLYLHQDSRLRIIHRDLKASNVLLDYEMNAKISDFGMARSFGGNETGANTTRVVGTYGYMSPEYAIDGLFSVKSDVFSFGVLVLEIVSGKKNRGFEHPDHDLNLIGHAWTLFGQGRSMELVDAPLIESCDLSEVLRSIHVGLLCVQKFPKDRPTMSSVVLMLGSQSALPQPKEPGFFIERNRLGKNENYSANEMTITLLAAR